MSAIKTIEYAVDYPWGVGTKGTGSGYLVNNVGGYAIGAKTIEVDTGSGTITVGDRVVFAGHTDSYRVLTALSGGSFVLETGLVAAVADNATVTLGPNWTEVTDFLDEDFEPGVENIIAARMGEGGEIQDGVELQGSFLATGSNVPTAGRGWLRFTPTSGTAQVVGGINGARIRTGKSSLRPLGGGPQYTRVEFSATGGAAADTVEDTAS